MLLARDAFAPVLIDEWARQRELAIVAGFRPEADRAKVAEARQCADAMRKWYRANRTEKS